jgi:hypothetical protein
VPTVKQSARLWHPSHPSRHADFTHWPFTPLRPSLAAAVPDESLEEINRLWTIARAFANTAHDVNNALQVIAGNAEFASTQALEPRAAAASLPSPPKQRARLAESAVGRPTRGAERDSTADHRSLTVVDRAASLRGSIAGLRITMTVASEAARRQSVAGPGPPAADRLDSAGRARSCSARPRQRSSSNVEAAGGVLRRAGQGSGQRSRGGHDRGSKSGRSADGCRATLDRESTWRNAREEAWESRVQTGT